MTELREPDAVRVVLRRFRDEPRDVIALFPDLEEGLGLVQSYMRVGQHATASRDLVYRTAPAGEHEPDAAALLAELRRIGYAPRVLRRMPRAAR